jgi:ABC-2 type transport system ATP-binding protein
MDAPSRQLFYDALLADFIEHPRMIVLSTHLIEEVARVFERLIIIDNGSVLLNETADALRGRGMTITGPAALTDPLMPELNVLGTRELGSTRSLAVLDPSKDICMRAMSAGLETGPMPLQDLFIHLTAKGDRK